MSIQSTFKGIKGKINTATASALEERLKDIAEYAVRISPVDTGAYVTSFSIGRAGFGGGRRSSSENKPKRQSKSQKQQEGLSQLYSDINSLNIEQDLKSKNVRFTLRNRSDHAANVENGIGWRLTQPYYVFSKIKRKFS